MPSRARSASTTGAIFMKLGRAPTTQAIVTLMSPSMSLPDVFIAAAGSPAASHGGEAASRRGRERRKEEVPRERAGALSGGGSRGRALDERRGESHGARRIGTRRRGHDLRQARERGEEDRRRGAGQKTSGAHAARLAVRGARDASRMQAVDSAPRERAGL